LPHGDLLLQSTLVGDWEIMRWPSTWAGRMTSPPIDYRALHTLPLPESGGLGSTEYRINAYVWA
jgi:hypothetical protein